MKTAEYLELNENRWYDRVRETMEPIIAERLAQRLKWGVRTQDDGTQLKILVEEVGEVAKAMLERQFDSNGPAAAKALRDEWVQVAAVAATAIQQLDYGEA